MGVKERKAREFERRQEVILHSAYQLLTTMDPPQMTVEKIAELAEIGRGTLYKHFNGKDEIYAHLILRRRERFRSRLETIRDEERDRIPRLINSYMEYCLEDPVAYEVHKKCERHCQRGNLRVELISALQRQQAEKIRLVEEILKRALGESVDSSVSVLHCICAGWGMQRGLIDAMTENRFEGAVIDPKLYFEIGEKIMMSGVPSLFR